MKGAGTEDRNGTERLLTGSNDNKWCQDDKAGVTCVLVCSLKSKQKTARSKQLQRLIENRVT